VQALALRVIAERLEHREAPAGLPRDMSASAAWYLPWAQWVGGSNPAAQTNKIVTHAPRKDPLADGRGWQWRSFSPAESRAVH